MDNLDHGRSLRAVNTQQELDIAKIKEVAEAPGVGAIVRLLCKALLNPKALLSPTTIEETAKVLFVSDQALRADRVVEQVLEHQEALTRIAVAISPLQRNSEAFGALIEHWIRCAGSEPYHEKRRFLTQCLLRGLERPPYLQADDFMRVLCDLNMLQLAVLIHLYRNNDRDNSVERMDIQATRTALAGYGRDLDHDELAGCMTTLSTHGLIHTETGGSPLRGAESIRHLRGRITDYGKRFCASWLSD